MRDEQSKEQQNVIERMLLLLDHAYESASSSEGYDDLLVEADNFFFPAAASNGLAVDLLEGAAEPEVLIRHVNRIQSLIDQGEVTRAGEAQPLASSRLASLVVSADGQTVIGNNVAADLFVTDFPTSLADLNFDKAFRGAINETLKELQDGSLEGSRVLPLRLNEQANVLLVKCTKLQSQSEDGKLRRGLSITVSHVNWGSDTLAFVRKQFNLSPAESELLHEMLKGASQLEAATKLSKSRETIKVQAKSVLRKFGMSQMSEVLHVVNTYAFLANGDQSQKPAVTIPESIDSSACQIIDVSGGRSVQLNRFGKIGGTPVLLFHGLYQGPFFSQRMSDAFAIAGLDVVSPSRPGFGRTDPPNNWADFNETVTRDVEDVCEIFAWDNVHYLVHQAGISFACRAAKTMASRVKTATMVGAGVPIEDHMMSKMNLETRVAAAATRYAPTMFDLLLRLGIAHWRRAGAAAYLKHYFGAKSVEWASLHDPEIGPLMEQGIMHMIAQGTKPIIHDGISAMSNWEALYEALDCPQLWIHGDQDPVMNHQFVQEFLVRKQKGAPLIIDGVGGDILYAAFDKILEGMCNLHRLTS